MAGALDWKEIEVDENDVGLAKITDHPDYKFDERRTGLRSGLIAETPLEAFFLCFPNSYEDDYNRDYQIYETKRR